MKFGCLLVQLAFLSAAGGGVLYGQEPRIDDFSPQVGAVGEAVLLTGVNFTSGKMTIRFYNGVTASIRTNSNTQITATVPAGAVSGRLSIQKNTGAQWFTTNSFTVIGTGPYISALSPDLGAVDDWITIKGAHLLSVTAVKFNGTNLPGTSFVPAPDGTSLSLSVPSGASTGPITVVAPAGTSNSPTPFTVIGPGPYISDFTPVSGDSTTNTTVYLNGRFLSSTTNVQFNHLNAAGFYASSATMVMANPPANVMSGPITVMTPLGSYTTPTNFFLPPAITNVAPAQGRAGTNVSIMGSSFIGTTSVTFNEVPATFSVISNWLIQAAAPAGVSIGPIWVAAPAGITRSEASFTVPPTVSGFAPSFGPVGRAVTITGANFNVGTPIVRFNGVQAAAPTGVTFGQLTATVPAGATTGLISVTTTNGSDTNATLFYLPATISSFTPTNSAPGTRVTITGQNFIGVTAVNFNGMPATFNLTNNSTIGATVPANVSTGPISVTTPAGTASSGGWFYGPPVITGFTPTHGTPGANVTITGTNFLDPITVRFGGLVAQISSLAKGQVVAVVPGGAQTGPLTVATPAGTNTTMDNFVVDYPADLFVWDGGSPQVVTVGSNLVYTIVLGNRGPFDALNAKFTNTLPASVDLISATINQGTLDTNGNPIIGTLGTLRNGSQLTCVLTVVPRAVGPITNTMSLGSDTLEPAPADNRSAFSTLVLSLPILSIGLGSAAAVDVSWPGDLTNYLLQYRPSLDPTAFWSNVVVAPVLSNNQHLVTEPLSAPARYYRLSR
jgi:large repetitive protein